MIDIDALGIKLAGIGGAVCSLAFIKGTYPQRLGNVIGGSILSFYAASWAASKTGLPEGLTGWLLGLFGMAICAKAWEFIQAFPIAETWQKLIQKVL